MITKFFVYGSLMRGLHNHKVIPQNSIESIENAIINNKELYSYIGGSFPCMIEGNSKVFGELITVKKSDLSKVLGATDRLEGYNEKNPKSHNFYNREVQEVILEDGSIVEAYVYMFNPNRGLGELVPEGNWREWKVNHK